MAMTVKFTLCVLLLSAFALGAGAEDWPTFHRDAARTGVSAEPWTKTALAVAWSVRLDDESVDSSPAVVGDNVYVGTASGNVFCVKASDGAKVWEATTGGAVISSPAVGAGVVVIGSADRCLYAFDTATGKLKWQVRTRRPVVAPPLLLEGKVYCGSMDGTFLCVRADTGEQIWSERERGEIGAGAAAAGDQIYYGTEAGDVVARSAADGKLSWTIHLAGGIVAALMIAGDKLIVPVMSGTALSPPPTQCITVLDRTTGKQLWALTKESSVMQTPVADDQFVYFATVSGYLSDTELLACRLTDGVLAWKVRLGGVADSSPLLSGLCLMFGNHDGNFYIIDKRNGGLWQGLPLKAKMFSSPALSEGAIYIGAQDGKLYCLK
jgi:outer membrane protein assembly factor BamB